MRLVTQLSYWEITLVDGGVLEVWDDGYQEVDGSYVFGALADVYQPMQNDLLITGRTPTDPRRVIVGLARFPVDAVRGIRGGGVRPLPR
jgi:hypothetical protein